MMTHAQNPSEQFVYEVCSKSFFSLWSYLNPLREDGAELCDILIQFGQHLIIFSVKDINFNEACEDWELAAERWTRSAVEKSIKQALGAEKYLLKKDKFWVKVTPPGELRSISGIRHLRVHRLAIALGGKGKIPIAYGIREERFVHVLEERGFWTLLTELDTISDFVEYLTKKEDFLMTPNGGVVTFGEEDLLALYLKNNRSFPSDHWNFCLIEEGFYQYLVKRPEFIAKKEKDRISYLVDSMINTFIYHYRTRSLINNASLTDMEKALAAIVSEDRLGRRMLGDSIYTVITSKDTNARIHFPDQSRMLYVIFAAPQQMEREVRRTILHARCHVAIGLLREKLDVLEAVGIATERFAPDAEGCSFDLMRLRYDEWTTDRQREMEQLQKSLGLWRNARFQNSHEDEYPNV